MASLRILAVFAFVAVGIQSGHGWKVTVPTLLGGSVTVNSAEATKSLGGKVTFEDGGIVTEVDLGPVGRVQSRVITPVIPSIGNLLKATQENLSKIGAKLTSSAGKIGSWASGVVNKGLGLVGLKLPEWNLWEKIVSNFTFVVNGVKTKVSGLISQAGGLLEAAVKQGQLSLKEANSVISAIIKSGLENTVNNISKLIDVLEDVSKTTIGFEKDAVKLLAKAVKDGVHKLDSAADWSVESFVDAATKAETISEKSANAIKAALASLTSSSDSDSKKSTDSDSTTSDSEPATAAAETPAAAASDATAATDATAADATATASTDATATDATATDATATAATDATAADATATASTDATATDATASASTDATASASTDATATASTDATASQ